MKVSCIFIVFSDHSDDDASLLLVGIHCLPCNNDTDDDDLPDSSQQDLIHSVIDDVQVDLQAEPFSFPISPPVMKKSGEIPEGKSPKKAIRKLDFGSSPRFYNWCW